MYRMGISSFPLPGPGGSRGEIDNSYIDLRFDCWLTSDRNEGGGERHRGMTSGQHDPKQPHKNTKAPGRHEATRTHDYIFLFMLSVLLNITNQFARGGARFFLIDVVKGTKKKGRKESLAFLLPRWFSPSGYSSLFKVGGKTGGLETNPPLRNSGVNMM